MRIAGMSLFPFVILREYYKDTDRGDSIVRHETIHFKQALYLGVIPFYLLYVLEYVILLFIYLNHTRAYLNISFEIEAYTYQDDLTYNRSPYSSFKYIFKKD